MARTGLAACAVLITLEPELMGPALGRVRVRSWGWGSFSLLCSSSPPPAPVGAGWGGGAVYDAPRPPEAPRLLVLS